MVRDYTIVIPVFNEWDTLDALRERLTPVIDDLDGPVEVLFVDDGSTDGSFQKLMDAHEADPRLKVIRLSRNFGHQVAITVGLDHASGAATILMDADLQDPPEVVPDMIARWQEGHDVVHAVRTARAGETRLKLVTAKWFYRVLGRLADVQLESQAGDFKLIDRRALDAMATMREHNRYLRGMVAWVGFKQTTVPYARDPRFAGSTKYPLAKMTRFAVDGIVSFTTAPLRLVLNIGFVVSILAFLLGFLTVALKIAGVEAVPGWASLTAAIAFLSGIQLTMIGVVGQYIAQIHEEVKERPLYLIDESVGLERDGVRSGATG